MPYTPTTYVDNSQNPPFSAANLNKNENQLASLTTMVENHNGYIADTGTVNAYVATLSPVLSAYANGVNLHVKIANTNTITNPTLNVNSLGVKTIYKPDGTALSAGDLLINMIYEFTYNSTLNGFVANISSSSGYLVGSTAPTNTKMFWIDSGNGNILKYYSGSAWVVVPSVWS